MEQTGVEFLVELLNNLNDDFNLAFKDEIEQAKEMEKQQIEDAYLQGFAECDATGIMDYKQYYKETFNK
jgi:hypothetical protein